MKKQVTISDSAYINFDKILSYGALINMVVGERGCGKSYGAKKWCIKRFFKKGEKFLYVKRYKSDLKDLDKFFDDIQHDKELSAHEFCVKGTKIYVDGLLAGVSFALSIAQTKKSVPYAEYNNMIFDEFILEQGVVRYLDNEVWKFLSLIDTFVRNRSGCKVFVLGNSVRWANPYFTFYKFTPNQAGIQIKQEGTVLLCNYKNEEFRSAREETEVGKLIKGTSYGDMSLKNEYSDVNDDFIKKKSSTAYLTCTIYWNGKYYGIWREEDCYVVSYKCNKEGGVFCYSKADLKPNMLLITQTNFGLNQSLKRAFKFSYLYYEDIFIRNEMFELIGLMGVR